MPVRVVIAIADRATRREAAEKLGREYDIQVVAEAQSRGEAVLECRVQQPDVAVLDLALPQDGAVQATRLIAGRQPNLKLVLLADSEEGVAQHAGVVAGAIKLGALGYIVQAGPEEAMRDAVRELVEGGVAISPAFARDLLRALHQAEAATVPGAAGRLSADERLILGLRGRGWSLAEIGARMSIGRADVRVALRAALDAFRTDQDEPPDMLGAPVPRRPHPPEPGRTVAAD